jgi:hypothetical protein
MEMFLLFHTGDQKLHHDSSEKAKESRSGWIESLGQLPNLHSLLGLIPPLRIGYTVICLLIQGNRRMPKMALLVG